MAAITRVVTIRRAAEILGRDEDLLWDISDQLDPEDGKLWITTSTASRPWPSLTSVWKTCERSLAIRSIAPLDRIIETQCQPTCGLPRMLTMKIGW